MEKYLLEDEIYQKNFLDIVADKARSYGFQVSFINDEHDDTVDYYMCIYLDIYKDFVLEHFKAIAKYFEIFLIDNPCSIFVIKLKNLFVDSLTIASKISNMELITKLYQRNNINIPETLLFHFQKALILHYITSIDLNKKENIRFNSKQLLLIKQAYIEYTKQMYKVLNPQSLTSIFSSNTKDTERQKNMGVFFKTGNPNNMPLKDLKKLGKVVDYIIDDKFIESYNRKLSETNIKYSLEKPYKQFDYEHYKKLDNFQESDIITQTFFLHVLKKDERIAKEAINKLEFRGFANITNTKEKEKLLNMDHIIFYVPSWYLQNFHTLAMKHNMNYYYFDDYEIEKIDQIPLITHASNVYILKKIMETCLINYMNSNRIYNPGKEMELYPESKSYPDINGTNINKPAYIIAKEINRIEKDMKHGKI